MIQISNHCHHVTTKMCSSNLDSQNIDISNKNGCITLIQVSGDNETKSLLNMNTLTLKNQFNKKKTTVNLICKHLKFITSNQVSRVNFWCYTHFSYNQPVFASILLTHISNRKLINIHSDLNLLLALCHVIGPCHFEQSRSHHNV